MYQLWLFIAPGLYSNEKRLAIPFVVLSTVGLLGGAVFNHYIMFPWMMRFFAGFNTQDLLFMPKLDSVFSLYTKFLLAMAVVFQMPTLVYFLAKMKLITARFLVSKFKYAVLVIFIISAVITPTGDPVTQTVFAAPMVGLYLLGILIAWVVGPKRASGVDLA
jgi:sec-independent protein translocase protein TatC